MGNEKQKPTFLDEVKNVMGNQYEEILNPERKNENDFIEATKRLVKKYKNDISTSQLRNIYSKIKNIRDDDYKKFYLLRPKLAYISGRAEKKFGMKKLIELLDDQIQKIDNSAKAKQFKSFFESVIAYHKFYGGTN